MADDPTSPPPRPLDYAPAPRRMSRKTFALIAGTVGATVVIGGVVYRATHSAPAPIIKGKIAPTVVNWKSPPPKDAPPTTSPGSR